VLTIDDRHTRDMDDAIEVEKTSEGWLVRVAISDVAKEVKPGSENDKTARERGHTNYYATGNSPMLPRDLADWRLSLVPQKERSAIVVAMTLDEALDLKKTEITLERITSEAKLAYDDIPEIIAILDSRAAVPVKNAAGEVDPKEPLVAGQSFFTGSTFNIIAKARKLALGLLAKRRDSGALVFYDVTNGWVTTEEGFVKKLKHREDTIGYIIIQELMILTNMAVAMFAVEQNIPFLYRNHQARSAAPDRAVIMQQIADATSMPIVDLSRLQQRTHLLFDKAFYGPKLLGHYGANLVAYAHFTSPIRRYADLSIHQQLRAHLKGRPLPYTEEAFAEIGKHLSELDLREKEEASEHFKEAREERAKRQINARQLDGLAPKDFERAVKVEMKSGASPSDVLVEAWGRRIAEGSIPIHCLSLVFMYENPPDGWQVLTQTAIDFLMDHPDQAVSTLNQAATIGWPLPSFQAEQTGPSHAPSFKCTAALKDKTAEATGKSAKEARQRACVKLLALLAGVDEPTFHDARPAPAAPPKVAAALDPSKNPISLLMERGQSMKVSPPSFNFEMAGQSHLPVVTCTAKFLGYEVRAAGPSKQEAKTAAAKALLEKL